jgi:RNA polymerase sigma factor (sigma-70 family)
VARQAEVAKVVRLAIRPPVTEQTDRELLAHYLAGDETAFATLVSRHGGMVFGLCRRILPTEQDAEDATQATFLVLSQKAKTNCWQTSIANWLYTTAWQIASTTQKSARNRSRLTLPPAKAGDTCLLDQMSGREVFQALDEELSKLQSRYREPLVLCYLEGLTRDEAAARLGVPVITLKGQLDRARKRLHTALTRRGIVPALGLIALDAFTPVQASSKLFHSILTAKEAPSSAVAQLVKGITMNTWIKKTALSITTVMGLAAVGVTALALQAQPEPTPKAAEQSASKAAVVAEEKPTQVSGQVVDPDGKPVAGVKLYTYTSKVKPPQSEEDLMVKLLGETAADGQFQVALRSDLGREIQKEFLIAFHEKWGVAWKAFDYPLKQEQKSVAIQLVKDVPITGRIIDSQGQAIGGVEVTLLGVHDSYEQSLDEYLANLKQQPLRSPLPNRGIFLNIRVRTDKDGRFTIPNVGVDRIAFLKLEDKTIAQSIIHVVLRPGFDAKPFNDLLNKPENAYLKENHFSGWYAPEFTFTARSGAIVEGVVSESGTGKPLAGCLVSSQVGYGDSISIRTDKDGHYRLAGLLGDLKNATIQVAPPTGTAYLRRIMPIPTKRGNGPVRLDVPLATGVMVKGRITDKQTGKGVRSGIRLAPLAGNRYFDSQPGYDQYRRDRLTDMTDAEGRFAIPTIPGQSLLMVQTNATERVQGQQVNPYPRAVPDPQYPDLFRAENASWTITGVDSSIEFLSNQNAVKVIDLKPEGEKTIDITLDRGITRSIEIQDKEGQSVKDVQLIGIADGWSPAIRLSDSKATLLALSLKQTRLVIAYHAASKQGAIAQVRGDEKGELTLRLGDMSSVKGRLLQADGTPLSGAQVAIRYLAETGQEFERYLSPLRRPIFTDKEGRFTIPQVLPGGEFQFSISTDVKFYAGNPKIGRHTLKAGEMLDLGDRKVV